MEWAAQVATDKHLAAGATFVLVAGLARHAGARSGKSWPAVDTLAGELHVHPSTITRAFAAIEKAKILEVERRRGWTTVWTFPAEARWTPRESRGGTPRKSRGDPPQIPRQPPANCGGDKGVTPVEHATPLTGRPLEDGSVYVAGEGWIYPDGAR